MIYLRFGRNEFQIQTLFMALIVHYYTVVIRFRATQASIPFLFAETQLESSVSQSEVENIFSSNQTNCSY